MWREQALFRYHGKSLFSWVKNNWKGNYVIFRYSHNIIDKGKNYKVWTQPKRLDTLSSIWHSYMCWIFLFDVVFSSLSWVIYRAFFKMIVWVERLGAAEILVQHIYLLLYHRRFKRIFVLVDFCILNFNLLI